MVHAGKKVSILFPSKIKFWENSRIIASCWPGFPSEIIPHFVYDHFHIIKLNSVFFLQSLPVYPFWVLHLEASKIVSEWLIISHLPYFFLTQSQSLSLWGCFSQFILLLLELHHFCSDFLILSPMRYLPHINIWKYYLCIIVDFFQRGTWFF